MTVRSPVCTAKRAQVTIRTPIEPVTSLRETFLEDDHHHRTCHHQHHRQETQADPGPAEDSGSPHPFPFPGINSLAFLGGTIERVRERCSGDFSLAVQTKLVQKLPPITPEWMEKELKDLNVAERAIAGQTGLNGRSSFGQGLIFDEVYGFLQDLSILDKPNEKRGSESSAAGKPLWEAFQG